MKQYNRLHVFLLVFFGVMGGFFLFEYITEQRLTPFVGFLICLVSAIILILYMNKKNKEDETGD